MNAIERFAASVIIPVRNSQDSIVKCIRSLKRQSVPEEKYEIIVVDDGSTDSSAQMAGAAGAMVLSIAASGPAIARNKGAEIAQSEILLFTDADCEPEFDWVEKMIQPFEDSSISGVKGVYRSRQQEMTARFVQAEYEYKYNRMSRFDTIDFIDTYSAGFRKSAFFEVGGFDGTFPTASVEDQEFSFRMHAHGKKMIFVQNAIVYHTHANRSGTYFRKKIGIGYWKVKVLREHPGKVIADSHTPQTLKLQIVLIFAFFASTPIAFAGYFLPSIFFLFAFFISTLSEISSIVKRRQSSLSMAAPFFIILRSIALGYGLLKGLSSNFSLRRKT